MRQNVSWIWTVAVVASVRVASATPAPSASPSFDCRKASTAVEQAICGDSDIATLDGKVAAAFKMASERATPDEKAALLAMQRKWLKQRGTNCVGGQTQNQCLTRSYRLRLAGLQQFVDDRAKGQMEIFWGGDLHRVFGTNPADGPKTFSGDIQAHKIIGRVVGCSITVEVPLTRYEAGQGGDCMLENQNGKKAEVFVCNDTGVGRFDLIPAGQQAGSAHDLAQFTADNCTGG